MSETDDDLRRELLRLLEGLELYRNWRLSGLRAAKGEVTQEDLDLIVMPAAVFRDVFERSKGAARRAVLKEVQSWYAHTASDLQQWRVSGGLYTGGDVEAFLKAFRETQGCSFWEESGYLKKLARKVLRRGYIAREQEFYALRELDMDLSQSVLTEAEMGQVRALLTAYEAQQEAG
ncbi:hypothetical protein [Shimia marina]|uniref:Uncharacterized protein n=1 Tax=Shimia marina TaxID=321267 RepID=A0A0P1EUT6_9RHOB|nr:hypothetical protein [Shimia marina]CUH54314.1 hypothetical protein SHM7688_03784 [Shimia marina]SFE00267.1 hypothetical protein SAMN04488037_104193 [Shimia marina]